MDKDGNLSQEDKLKLANLLLFAKKWWDTPTPSINDTEQLIERFENFRKCLED